MCESKIYQLEPSSEVLQIPEIPESVYDILKKPKESLTIMRQFSNIQWEEIDNQSKKITKEEFIRFYWYLYPNKNMDREKIIKYFWINDIDFLKVSKSSTRNGDNLLLERNWEYSKSVLLNNNWNIQSRC